jgi:hypothetical protein
MGKNRKFLLYLVKREAYLAGGIFRRRLPKLTGFFWVDGLGDFEGSFEHLKTITLSNSAYPKKLSSKRSRYFRGWEKLNLFSRLINPPDKPVG